MSVNPVLAHFVRGNWVENRHRGAWCVADSSANVLASDGDVSRSIFPRSAIKAIQAIPLFETGAPERFGLTEKMLALACASHHGEPEHVEVAAAILDALGLDHTALECGAHPPTNPAARKALRSAGVAPTALHNNCSGKHAGMLAVAKAMGVDHKGYSERGHPAQVAVRKAIEAVLGVPMREDKCGTDGCSIPTWAAPLDRFAIGFARMASGQGLETRTASAAHALFDAATAHPFLVGGTGVFDTEIMAAFGGRVMVKLGAEGVFCGALRDKGIGFALKCDDGNLKAATAMVAGLLLAIADPDARQRQALERFVIQPVNNWRGIEVGAFQSTMPETVTLG